MNLQTFSDEPHLFIGKYLIPPETPGPINIETNKVHKVTLPPLKFTILINENMRLSNTGNSIGNKYLLVVWTMDYRTFFCKLSVIFILQNFQLYLPLI